MKNPIIRSILLVTVLVLLAEAVLFGVLLTKRLKSQDAAIQARTSQQMAQRQDAAAEEAAQQESALPDRQEDEQVSATRRLHAGHRRHELRRRGHLRRCGQG